MENIFYNIVSILIGLILVVFISLNLKKEKIIFSIITFLHAGLFLFSGIGGFFLPKEYQYITILAMLALCITMLISILLLKKPKNEKKDKSTYKAVK